jgi:hypothetical protein
MMKLCLIALLYHVSQEETKLINYLIDRAKTTLSKPISRGEIVCGNNYGAQIEKLYI